MKLFFALSLSILGAAPALADQVARWVIGGTFATSGYAVNLEREKSYLGAGRENKRLLTFLPGMTILYGGEPLNDPTLGYDALTGQTQSGIPVAIARSEVSQGDFSTRDYRDVVVHQRHGACRQPGCDEADLTEVGIGHGFTIESEDEQGIFMLNADELRVHYTLSEFDRFEREGHLTRHKGRTYPRIEIVEGYASKISMPCGETRTAGAKFQVPASEMAKDPSEWEINSLAWSAKAIEIFDFGTATNSGDVVEVQLGTDIAHDGEGKFALDFTVFAFKDAANPAAEPRWTALLSVIKCIEGALGSANPGYVDEVWLVNAEGQRQLPQQLAGNQKAQLSPRINRSFFYSFNSAVSYSNFFPVLANAVGNNHLSTFLISRLNATCASAQRSLCNELSLYEPIADVRPVARPGT